MLIRWANEEERARHGYESDAFGPYDVLAAVDRMSGSCLGIVGFLRSIRSTGQVQVFAPERQGEIEERLLACVDRQQHPKGHSFHYRYPEYVRESAPEHCPACNHLPMPEGLVDILELPFSTLTGERQAQGRLFGKCHLTAKNHYVHLWELPPEELLGFMQDVGRAARALQEVTGAVKINYEIHGNSAPHLHCHLFPRYLDDDFPGQGIDVRAVEPSPYESDAEFDWFIGEMRRRLSGEV